MPSFTRNEKILLRSSEQKNLLVEKYEDELNKLYQEDGEGRRTRQSSAGSVMHSVFEKDRDRRKDVEEVEKSLPRDTHWYETKVEFRGIKVPIRIPMTTFAEDVGEVSLKLDGELIPVLDRGARPDILHSQPIPTALPPTLTYQRSSHPSRNPNSKRDVGA
jgi:hypothetical protein